MTGWKQWWWSSGVSAGREVGTAPGVGGRKLPRTEQTGEAEEDGQRTAALLDAGEPGWRQRRLLAAGLSGGQWPAVAARGGRRRKEAEGGVHTAADREAGEAKGEVLGFIFGLIFFIWLLFFPLLFLANSCFLFCLLIKCLAFPYL